MSYGESIPKRKRTRRVILHHALAQKCTVDDIDRWHRAKGYLCIGYHYLVTKVGKVVPGRSEGAIGAHALWRNGDSVGVCLEGDFRCEEPPLEQVSALAHLYGVLCLRYGAGLKIEFHRPHVFNLFEPSSYGRYDACPGFLLDRSDALEILTRTNPYSTLHI